MTGIPGHRGARLRRDGAARRLGRHVLAGLLRAEHRARDPRGRPRAHGRGPRAGVPVRAAHGLDRRRHGARPDRRRRGGGRRDARDPRHRGEGLRGRRARGRERRGDRARLFGVQHLASRWTGRTGRRRSRALHRVARDVESPARLLSKKIFSSVSVFAPASVANFGVGTTSSAPRSRARATSSARASRTRPASGSSGSRATAAASRARRAATRPPSRPPRSSMRRGERRRGLELTLEKGLPLSSGMGSSAASAAAGALAAGLLLGMSDRAALLGPALLGEHVADGSWHGDNVFASLLGGLVLVPSSDPDGPLAARARCARPRACASSSSTRLSSLRRAAPAASSRARFRWPSTRRTRRHSRASSRALADGDLARAGQPSLEDRLVDPARLPLIRGGRAVARRHARAPARSAPASRARARPSSRSPRTAAGRGADRARRRGRVAARRDRGARHAFTASTRRGARRVRS